MELGLRNLNPLYIYIGEGDGKDTEDTSLWYSFNHESFKKVPITEDSVIGYLMELHMFNKPHKGQDQIKLRIKIRADRIYFIQIGIKTIFARKFILAAIDIKDLTKPISISVQPAQDKKVVFCNLSEALEVEGKEVLRFIKIEWNEKTQLFPLVQELQKRLGNPVQTTKDLEAKK